MSRFPVPNVGALGLVSRDDALSEELPPNAWNVAKNIRFRGVDVEAAKGWEQIGTVGDAGGVLDYVVGGLTTWWLYYGDTAIYSVVAGYLNNDVTGTSGPYTSGDWSVTNFQGIPVATNGVELPQTQFVAGSIPLETTVFQDLPTWPATDKCKIISTLGNFLVAFDLTEGGTRYPTKIRWSNAAAPGDLPPDWSVSDPTSLAGEIVIGTGQGQILAVEPMRDSLIVYRENGVGILSYVGGNAVLRYREITNKWGAFGKHCVAQTKTGLHIIVTQDDIVVFDGQTEKSVARHKVKTLLFRQLLQFTDSTDLIKLFAFPKSSEIWLGLPDVDTLVIDEVYVYNYDDGTWAGPREVPAIKDYRYLPQLDLSSTLNLQLSWNEAANTPELSVWPNWDGIPWGATQLTSTEGAFHLFSTNASGDLIKLDYGYAHQGVNPYLTDLQRQDINLTDDENTNVVLAVYPRGTLDTLSETITETTWADVALDLGITWDDVDWTSSLWSDFPSGVNPLEIYVGYQDSSGDVPIWGWRMPKIFIPTDYKITCKVRGRRHAIRFRSEAIAWRISGYDIEYTRSGRR